MGGTEKAVALFDRASQHAEKAKSEFAAASRAAKADGERLARLEKGILKKPFLVSPLYPSSFSLHNF